MTKRTRGEFELIEILRACHQRLPAPILKSIGDDCAVVDTSSYRRTTVTTDMLVEDVHFRCDWTSPWLLGRKAVRVNVSDLAAMGASPLFCLLNLGIPAHLTGDFFEEFMAGFLLEAGAFDLPLAGGDLSGSQKIIISVTAFGTVEEGEPIYRSGARIGDQVFIAGELGASRLGLQLLETGRWSRITEVHRQEDWDGFVGNLPERTLLEAHFVPPIYLATARWLQRNHVVNAMIDVSDGFSADLLHILEESGVAAEIDPTALPLPTGVARFDDVREVVLEGGEDYALLFTASPEQARAIRESYPSHLPDVRRIGTILPGSPRLFIRGDDGRIEYEPRGFDHFK